MFDRVSKKCGHELAHHPAEYDKRDAYALQALAEGIATDEQQKKALDWIVHAAGTFDMSYRPEDAQATAFAEGRRFVGLQIVKLLKLNPGKLKD